MEELSVMGRIKSLQMCDAQGAEPAGAQHRRENDDRVVRERCVSRIG